MGVTIETRRASHKDIALKADSRRAVILETLSDEPRGMTAEEVADKLLQNGVIRRFDMNYVRPRLTELKAAGKVVTNGKRRSYRTGKATAVWMVQQEGVDVNV